MPAFTTRRPARRPDAHRPHAHAHRPAVRLAGACALALVPLGAGLGLAPSAAAHGSMEDPVSRVAACFAEGPENPTSAACKAAVAASGPQAFYDWNEVNIADAAGRSRTIIPDGKLCGAGREKYRGLDLPRADWPASPLSAGPHTFRYKVTAPHAGSIALYMTKQGWDPEQPLGWGDLESEPFARVENPQPQNGAYVFEGDVPERTGRALVYSVWQRSDSPEAFYTCSDVEFDGAGSAPEGSESEGSAPEGSASEPASSETASSETGGPQAPDDAQIAAGAERSSVDHGGHGGDSGDGHDGHDGHQSTAPQAAGGAQPQGGTGTPERLAETGADASTSSGTALLAVGGAAVLALGAGVLFASLRRGPFGGGRHRA